LDLLEKDQELKIIEMEVELNGVEDSIENAALLETRLSEAKSLVEDLASTINSLEIKVNSKEEIRESEKSLKLRYFSNPISDF
ncbi:hypothetical protein G4T31_003046, partial [Listeria monocytogenes]|nr:hypothetical protein [Listeria monocytogenes]